MRLYLPRRIVSFTIAGIAAFLLLEMTVLRFSVAEVRDLFSISFAWPMMAVLCYVHGYLSVGTSEVGFLPLFAIAFLGLEMIAWGRQMRGLAVFLVVYAFISMAAGLLFISVAVPP